MSVTESILRRQIVGGLFENEADMVGGLAQRAVDPAHGYESLSAAQKGVLEPFLTQSCSGYTTPGGRFNKCEQVLTGTTLLEAYGHNDVETLECENCRAEREAGQHTWKRDYAEDDE